MEESAVNSSSSFYTSEKLDKIILDKIKKIEETPISPQNMNAIAINTTNIKRPQNPVGVITENSNDKPNINN